MKFTTNFILTLVVGVAIASMVSCGGADSVSGAKIGKSSVDSASYGLGVLIGGRFLPTEFYEELNLPLLAKGIQDSRDSSMVITPEEANEIVQAYNQVIQDKKNSKNIEANNQFLEENKTKEGVQVTASGLQYRVINEGTGAKPTINDFVKVNYRGTRYNGEEFDSGAGTQFGVGQVITGWQEGLQLMSVGAKYEFFIPGNLAYGANPPQRSNIQPEDALVFTVELLDIVDPSTIEKPQQ